MRRHDNILRKITCKFPVFRCKIQGIRVKNDRNIGVLQDIFHHASGIVLHPDPGAQNDHIGPFRLPRDLSRKVFRIFLGLLRVVGG